MSVPIYVDTRQDYSVPLFLFEAHQKPVNTSVLILPALGISAKYYFRLASAIAALGVNAVVFEQRGHGSSSIRASRSNNYGFREWLQVDLPASFQWIRENLGGEAVLMGHSLGGHIAACYAAAHPDQVRGLILSASGTPWIGAYQGTMKLKLWMLCGLVPLISATLGYYRGSITGFGGSEGKRLMKDWLAMAKTNKYVASGSNQDFDHLVAAYPHRVLALRYHDDEMASEAATEAILQKFSSAKLDRELITSKQLGMTANHVNWMKEADCAANIVVRWHSEIDPNAEDVIAV